MNQRTPDPALDRIWAEEVRYLHSLWHNGLSSNPNPALQPSLPVSNTINTHHILRASPQTSFKKPKSSSKKPKKIKKIKNNNQDSELPETSEIQWPCEPSPEPRKGTEWPQILSHSGAAALPISTEEQLRREILQLQQRSIKVSQEFFGANQSSDCEDSEEEEEEGEGGEEGKFFLGVFKGDCELRSYYEKKWESGEFWCLVCCGSGRKRWKKFKNCVALVQHSIAISRTDRKRAHRAFAEVVCRVLGWDIKRLPSIVVSVEPLGQSLAQTEAQTQVGSSKENDKVVVVNIIDDDKNGDVTDACAGVVDDVGSVENKLKDCIEFQGVLKNNDTSDQSKDIEKDGCPANE